MSCLEHTRCPAWNTRDVLLGTHEMSCLEHRKCPASRALAAKPTPNAERGTRNSAFFGLGYDGLRRRRGARRAKSFQNLIRVDAVDFVKKHPKSELSSRFFGRLKILQALEGRLETCEVPIWRSCEFLSVTSRFVSKSYPRCPKIQLSMIFGGGVNKSISIFFLTFGQN